MSIFSDKVCIVTGGASGLGLEVCRQLAAAGASVVLADIDSGRATEAAAAISQNISQSSGNVKPVRVDVTDPESVRALIEGSAEEFGRIDYLFNNAGVGIMGEIRDLSLEQWHRVLDVNLFGVINGIHYAYPIMIRQGFGHIVNTASGFGMAPGALFSPYVASKFAVYGISHALAIESKAFGIQVSVVCPGFIKTPMVEHARPLHADATQVMGQMPVKLVSAERAAELMLKGVARGKAIIAFPGYVHALTFLHRHLPGLFNRIGYRQMEDFRKVRVVKSE